VLSGIVEFIGILLLLLLLGLLVFFIDWWPIEACEENRKEFEKADSNSMNAWKHFPW
jgi:hypothetical protein